MGAKVVVGKSMSLIEVNRAREVVSKCVWEVQGRRGCDFERVRSCGIIPLVSIVGTTGFAPGQ